MLGVPLKTHPAIEPFGRFGGRSHSLDHVFFLNSVVQS